MIWKTHLLFASLLIATFFMKNPPLLFDFGSNNNFGRWSIINDGVMGGLSQSKALLDEESVLFEGYVSLKNNGGFVSLRSPMGNYDLSSYQYCEMRFKSDSNREFELLLEKETAYYLPKFRFKFVASHHEWKTLKIPVSDFQISRMGNTIQNGIDPSLLNKIQRIGIILSDKKEGDFKLWIDYIKFS